MMTSSRDDLFFEDFFLFFFLGFFLDWTLGIVRWRTLSLESQTCAD